MKYYHPVAFLEVYNGENSHTLKFCCYFIHRSGMVWFPFQGFIQVPWIQTYPQFLLNCVIWWMVIASVLFYNYIRVYPVSMFFTSSSIPCFTRDLISSLKADSRWIGTFLGACHAGLYSGLRWNLYGSPGKCPIPSKQPEYCDRMSCFVNGNLFTEVLPLCGCLNFLEANNSLSLQTWTVGWWTCIQCSRSALHEVSACTCTGLTFSVVILPVIAVEGVMVLKEVTNCTMFCTMWLVLEGFPESMCMVLEWYCSSYCWGAVPSTVLEWYCPSYCFCMVLGVVLKWNCPLCCFGMVLGMVLGWYCSLYCFSHRSCRIWKTFEDAPLDVLSWSWVHFLPSQYFPLGS